MSDRVKHGLHDDSVNQAIGECDTGSFTENGRRLGKLIPVA